MSDCRRPHAATAELTCLLPRKHEYRVCILSCMPSLSLHRRRRCRRRCPPPLPLPQPPPPDCMTARLPPPLRPLPPQQATLAGWPARRHRRCFRHRPLTPPVPERPPAQRHVLVRHSARRHSAASSGFRPPSDALLPHLRQAGRVRIVRLLARLRAGGRLLPGTQLTELDTATMLDPARFGNAQGLRGTTPVA